MTAKTGFEGLVRAVLRKFCSHEERIIPIRKKDMLAISEVLSSELSEQQCKVLILGFGLGEKIRSISQRKITQMTGIKDVEKLQDEAIGKLRNSPNIVVFQKLFKSYSN